MSCPNDEEVALLVQSMIQQVVQKEEHSSSGSPITASSAFSSPVSPVSDDDLTDFLKGVTAVTCSDIHADVSSTDESEEPVDDVIIDVALLLDEVVRQTVHVASRQDDDDDDEEVVSVHRQDIQDTVPVHEEDNVTNDNDVDESPACVTAIGSATHVPEASDMYAQMSDNEADDENDDNEDSGSSSQSEELTVVCCPHQPLQQQQQQESAATKSESASADVPSDPTGPHAGGGDCVSKSGAAVVQTIVIEDEQDENVDPIRNRLKYRPAVRAPGLTKNMIRRPLHPQLHDPDYVNRMAENELKRKREEEEKKRKKRKEEKERFLKYVYEKPLFTFGDDGQINVSDSDEADDLEVDDMDD